MGRPLNKRFFGDLAGRIACTADVDGSGAEAAFIVEQRSNAKYRVQTEATFASNALVVGVQYQIVTVGTGVWADAGAPAETVGTVFTATATTNGQADGTADARAVCVIVDTAPNPNEMRVEVQAENAVTPVEATFTVNRTGAGAIDAVTIVTGGYGYWAGGTFNIGVNTDGGYVAGTEAVVTYTVANGSIDGATITTPGAGFTAAADTALAVDTADVADEATDPPLQYARIINARQVKTFEGNTYDWPITAPLGTPVPNGLTQADLESQ